MTRRGFLKNGWRGLNFIVERLLEKLVVLKLLVFAIDYRCGSINLYDCFVLVVIFLSLLLQHRFIHLLQLLVDSGPLL